MFDDVMLQYAGIAGAGKNVFVGHLKSFQQFSMNMKINGQVSDAKFRKPIKYNSDSKSID